MIFQLPYTAIGIALSLVLIVWALVVGGTKSRMIIGSIVAILFFLPAIFPRSWVSRLSFLGWLFLGMGSFIYLKYHGHVRWR
jgi:hypothetical protein